MLRRFARYMLVTLTALSLLLCGTVWYKKPRIPAPTTKPTDVGAKYIPPRGTGRTKIDGVDYDYIATAEREAQIVSGFAKLKLGQSREEVRAAMGLPDKAGTLSIPSENEPFVGWWYKYWIRISSYGPDSHDQDVDVYFDANGKLDHAGLTTSSGTKIVGR